MAMGRMINRDFFTSADLTDLPWWGHLLFAGMIVFADDAGVIRADPGYLRNLALVWRGDGSARADRGPRRVPSLAAVRLVLGQLVARGCLELGNFENVSCYKITNFTRFQRLKRREGKRREEKGREARTDARVPEAAGDDSSGAMEAYYDQDQALVRELQKFMRCSPAKAREVFPGLREPRHATLAAWRAYEAREGSGAALGAIQAFSHPDEVPAKTTAPRGGLARADLTKVDWKAINQGGRNGELAR